MGLPGQWTPELWCEGRTGMDSAERWAELSWQRVDHGGGLKWEELQPVGETGKGLGDQTLESSGGI